MSVGRGSGAPTIRDVARVAGVSHQTVSRALNTPDTVGPATMRKVRSAIEALGYERSPLAHGLATNRSRLIGLIDTGSEVLGQILLRTGVEGAARRAGYQVRTVVLPDGKNEEAAHGAVLRSLRSERVEGLIVMGNSTLHVAAATLAASRLPVVLVRGDEGESEDLVSVTIDQRGGAEVVLRHLVASGRSRIGHISGPEGWLDADLRRQVWVELTGGDPELYYRGDWAPESGYEGAAKLLQAGADAIFASNDYMALGALRLCAERGVRVPLDVAVAGFDDVLGSAYYNPPLTTVRQPFDNLGARTVELLVRRMSGGHAPDELLTPELVVRGST